MSKVICFIGVLGSGKDHQSRKLVKEGYVQINFADELREMAWSILGWRPKNDEEYDLFKHSTIESFIPASHKNNKTGFTVSLMGSTGRQFLQNLGSTMRERDPDYWVKCWFDKALKALSEGNKVCCSDCRFLNEVNQGMRLGSDFIFCNYKSSRYDAENTHESEHFAQKLLLEGLKDLQEIDKDYLVGLLNES